MTNINLRSELRELCGGSPRVYLSALANILGDQSPPAADTLRKMGIAIGHCGADSGEAVANPVTSDLPKPWNWREHFQPQNKAGEKVLIAVLFPVAFDRGGKRIVYQVEGGTIWYVHDDGSQMKCGVHHADLIPVTPPERWEPWTAAEAYVLLGNSITCRGTQYYVPAMTMNGIFYCKDAADRVHRDRWGFKPFNVLLEDNAPWLFNGQRCGRKVSP